MSTAGMLAELANPAPPHRWFTQGILYLPCDRRVGNLAIVRQQPFLAR